MQGTKVARVHTDVELPPLRLEPPVAVATEVGRASVLAIAASGGVVTKDQECTAGFALGVVSAQSHGRAKVAASSSLPKVL